MPSEARRPVATTPAFTRYNRRVNLDDTIVAIATPPGRVGIGVVRLAGARALEIAAPMLRLKHELEPGRAVFGELVDSWGAGEKPETTDVHAGIAGAVEPSSAKAVGKTR